MLLLCIAEIPKSTYYEQKAALNKVDKDEKIKAKILEIYEKHKGRYGYRRITIALNMDENISKEYGPINHKKVSRLMKLLGLKAIIRKKKYKSYRGNEGKIAPNILNRDFTTCDVEQKAVTDVTEFRIKNEKAYLSPLIDLHTSEVLGYSLSKSPSVSFVIEMLEKSLLKEKYENLIIHSDQGFQYQNIRYRNWLKERAITQSMSRKGNCYDNSLAENFFSHLKAEFFHVNEFNSYEHFAKELENYIMYYNNERIISKLKMPPVEYRQHCLANI